MGWPDLHISGAAYSVIIAAQYWGEQYKITFSGKEIRITETERTELKQAAIMFFSIKSRPKYISLEDSVPPEYDAKEKLNGDLVHSQNIRVHLSWLTLILLMCIPLTSITTLLVNHFDRSSTIKHAGVACISPPIRREWRTLDRSDRTAYVNAVQCLTTLPSSLRDNGTVYDDFPWVHNELATTGK